MAEQAVRRSPADIGERLRAQFGEDVVGADDVHGDAQVTIGRGRWVEAATLLRDEPALACDYFDFLTAVDFRPKGRGFEVVLQVHSTRHKHNVRLKTECAAEDPTCPSLSGVWPGANWFERETAELFGITFEGHPHPVRLVLHEQFEGTPLRKDFSLMTRVAKPWPGEAEGEGEEAEE